MTNKQENLVSKIEAILFYLAEPASIKFLSDTLGVSKDKVTSSVGELSESLKERGVRVVVNNDEVSLVTAPEMSGIIEKIIKEERERDLGKAGIETLAIVAYKGPVTKKEIEYIRGVNSQYALRSLLLRGLVERSSSKDDERMMVYSITVDALRYLGLSHISDLPEYNENRKQLEVTEDIEETKEENGEQ